MGRGHPGQRFGPCPESSCWAPGWRCLEEGLPVPCPGDESSSLSFSRPGCYPRNHAARRVSPAYLPRTGENMGQNSCFVQLASRWLVVV